MSANRPSNEQMGQVPIFFLEPSERLARQQFIHSKLRKVDGKEIDTEEIKKKLKKVREDAKKNLKRNLKTLAANLQKKGLDIFHADTSSDAASFIKEILKKSKLKDICINNSTAVKEIIGHLPSNITLYDTYHASQKEIEDSKHLEFWEVPKISDEHLWNSFDLFKAKYKEPLDFASLIGVNSVSTSGEFYLVQHFNNISSLIAQSRETILVVSLEKVVADSDSARLVARASGLFGLRSLLLGILSYDSPMNKVHVDELSKKFSKSSSKGSIHVIILDNGRSDILDGDYSEFLECINCRACGCVCPRSLFLKEGEYRTPRELVLLRFSESLSKSVEEGLYNCSLCRSCMLACPLEIPLPDFLQSIRNEVVKANLTPKKHEALGDNIRTHGNPYGRGD